MDIRFDGRVVLVTGAGHGLGRDYSLELARRGAKVVVNDLGGSGAGRGASHAAADEVVDLIRSAGGSAVANYDSVATRQGGAAIVQTALDAFGRLDAVINNAGFLRNNRFEDLTDEDIDAVIDVHLKGAFYVSQPAFRAMKANGYGRFLFTGSASAMFGHAWQANYSAAKGGLMGLSHVVSIEGEPHGILSNLLMPTAATRLADEMSPGFLEVPNFAAGIQRVAWPETAPYNTPAFNMPLAVYLVSEACRASHNLYSHCSGRYARVSITAAGGWHAPGQTLPTVEELAAHWAEVENDATRHASKTVDEEFEAVLEGRRALAGG